VCDFDHAAILQVTNYNSSNVTVGHNAGSGVTTVPGNCSKGLGYPTNCSSVNGNGYEFGPNSQIAKVSAVDWYIGNNGRAAEGGKSLFRRRLTAGTTVSAEEIVAGVTNLQITYRLAGSNALVPAGSITSLAQWDEVNAVAFTLTLDSADRNISTASTTNSGRLRRSFTWIVSVRNRLQ
jgi:type IV pilus assembly protein PilW